MKKNIAYTLALLLGLAFTACQSSQDHHDSQSEETQETTLTEESSSPLVGTYAGVLGCGLTECSGDPGSLILNADHVYTKEKVCPKNEKHIEEIGSWTFDEGTARLTLAPGVKGKSVSVYRVEQDKLILLDDDGHDKQGDTPDHYVLHKK